jgi:hypothetical protein
MCIDDWTNSLSTDEEILIEDLLGGIGDLRTLINRPEDTPKLPEGITIGEGPGIGIHINVPWLDNLGILGKRPGLPNPGDIPAGSKPQDVIDLLPPHIVQGGYPTRSGGGTRYPDPDRHGDVIRIMPGDPASPDPLHQGPYVEVSKNGQETRIPLEGNPTLQS